MKHIKKIAATAVALSLLAGAGLVQAQQAPKPEQLIKTRQSSFQLVAWHVGRVKASLDGTYNKDDVQRSANAIAAIANSGLGGLFAPGSESGNGWHNTTAKPEAFKDTAKFGQYGAAFAKEASALASVNAGGDVAAIKAQFANLQKTCKTCHDDFKNKE